MKNTEIRELSDKELNGRISEEKQLLTKMRFSNAVSPLDNPRKIKESKKTDCTSAYRAKKASVSKRSIKK